MRFASLPPSQSAGFHSSLQNQSQGPRCRHSVDPYRMHVKLQLTARSMVPNGTRCFLKGQWHHKMKSGSSVQHRVGKTSCDAKFIQPQFSSSMRPHIQSLQNKNGAASFRTKCTSDSLTSLSLSLSLPAERELSTSMFVNQTVGNIWKHMGICGSMASDPRACHAHW